MPSILARRWWILFAVLALHDGIDPGKLHAEFDGFARGARGGDDDDAAFVRPAGITLAGRGAGDLDHAAPFQIRCRCVQPDSTQQNARRATYAAGERAGSRPLMTEFHARTYILKGGLGYPPCLSCNRVCTMSS